MLIETRARKEQAEGLLEDIAYEIENGPHMMQILSGLYKNPVEAMVREYLTNMYDAHIALFNATGSWGETPTLVLPSALSPFVKFVDKGIGMTPEIIKRVYTKYGASSKNGSNDEIGGFGLGAKVAFTYNGGVDWTVESVRDGQKHTYVARLGKGDMPVLSHIASEDCDEHSGTTVTIPINRGDINAVHTAAMRMLYFFPIKINVENGNMPNVPAPMYSGKNWKMWSPEVREQGLEIVVGNVPYNVDDYDIPAFGALPQFFTRNSWTVSVPVGSVDIVPSRDNLKMTDRTKATIGAVLAEAAKEFGVAAAGMLSNCATEWEARITLNGFNSIKYIDSVGVAFVWNGQKLVKGEAITRNVTDFKGVTFRAFALVDSYSSKIHDMVYDGEFSIKTDGTTHIMVNDVTKGEVRIANSYASDKFVAKTHTGRAQRWGGHKIGKVILVTMPSSWTLDMLSAKLGGFPVDMILKASSFKALKVSGVSKLSAENIYKWSGRSWQARVNIPDDGTVNYYLPLTQKSGTGRWCYKNSHDIAEGVVNMARRMLGVGAVYGIRITEVADYDATEWINLETALVEYGDKFMADNDEAIKMWALYKNTVPRYVHILNNAQLIKDATPELTALTNRVVEIEKAVAEIEPQANDLGRIVMGFHSKAKDSVAGMPNELETLYEAICNKYPLLGIMFGMTDTYGYGRILKIDNLAASDKGHLLDYLAGT